MKKRPNADAERKPLRVINAFVMASIIHQIDSANRDGWSADEIARHLWEATARPLARTVQERYLLADVLTALSSQLELDARAEEKTRALARGESSELERPAAEEYRGGAMEIGRHYVTKAAPRPDNAFTRADGRELGIES